MATRFLGSSDGCVVNLNYDAILLVATGVSIDNAQGIETVTFWIVVAGVVMSKTVVQGATDSIVFPVAIGVTVSSSSLSMSTVGSYGIGAGVDMAVIGLP